MAAGTPDEKFQRLREENERRRKKKDEEEKRRKQEEEQKSKEALERRRLERVEQDERMRKPWQQPPAPKKPILRKGAKHKPVQPSSPAADPVRQSHAEDKRKEMRAGLQDFIKQQRQAAAVAKTPTGGGAGPSGGHGNGGGQGAEGGPVVPLTWEELRMAAEAGFDELLKQQELQAEQRANEEPASRTARHRTPHKSPFRGAPAHPQETIQVALVPTQQLTGLAAGPSAAGSPRTPSHHSSSAADAAAAAAAAAALRNSYKFSDAPGWMSPSAAGAAAPPAGWPQQQQHGAGGGDCGGGAGDAQGHGHDPRLQRAADTGTHSVGTGGDGDPAGVLYPPLAGDMPGRGSWADGFVGRTGDSHAGAGGGSVEGSLGFRGDGGGSVASSGGLRRGVTSMARHRAAPVDPSALDLPAAEEDPWAMPPPDGPDGSAVKAGGSRSPRGSGQRMPLPGPYDSPSQQQWQTPQPGQGGRASGQPRLAVPTDPLEASLQSDGTLAALQQADGFRLSSPRPSAQQYTQPQEQYTQQQQQHPQQASQSSQSLQFGSQDYPGANHHSPPPPLPQQQQPPPAKSDQRQARRGWGVPAQQQPQSSASDQPQQHYGDTPAEPPPPPWVLVNSDEAAAAAAAAAGPAWGPEAGEGGPAAAPAYEFSNSLPPQARSPAAIRHSVGVGDSGGPEMWSRESVMLQAPPPQHVAAPPGLSYSQTGAPLDAQMYSSSPPPQGLSPRVEEDAAWPPPGLPPGPRVDLSADLVRFSSPPGPSQVSSDVSAETSPSPPQPGQQQPQQQRHRLSSVSYDQRPPADSDAESPQPMFDAGVGSLRGPGAAAGEPGGGSAAQSSAAMAAGTPPEASLLLLHNPALTQSDGAGARDSVRSVQHPADTQSNDAFEPQPQPQPLTASQQQQQLLQGPLLPPIAPARPPSRHSSAAASIQQAAPAAVPLPPLTTPSQPAASTTDSAASTAPPYTQPPPLQPPQPQPQPPQPQPQPAYRGPSPPASPPRAATSTSQRFHRQHSASNLQASGLPAAAIPLRPYSASNLPAGALPLRPHSEDGQGARAAEAAARDGARASATPAATRSPPPSCRAVMPSSPPQQQHQQQPPKAAAAVPPSPPLAVVTVEEFSPPAAMPASPRMPGIASVTPASPSRFAAPPPAGAAPWQQQQQPQQQPSAPVHASHAAPGTFGALAHTSGAGPIQQQPHGIVPQGPYAPAAAAAASPTASPVRHSRTATTLVSARAFAAGRSTAGLGAVYDPPVVAEEPSEEGPLAGGGVLSGEYVGEDGDVEMEAEVEVEGGDEDAEVEMDVDGGDGDDGFAQGQGSSRGLNSSLGRPPGTAEGASVLTGSHISARPWSGPSAGPGSRLGGSGYQTSLLDDSVSSFDFRQRSAAASRPASASCVPASPSQLLYPSTAQRNQQQPEQHQQVAQHQHALPAGVLAAGVLPAGVLAAGSGSAAGKAPQQAAHPVPPAQGQAQLRLSQGQGSMSAYGPIHGSAAASHGLRGGPGNVTAGPNAFQVLQRPAGGRNLYGAEDDGDGEGQPFTEEAVEEPDEHPPGVGAGSGYDGYGIAPVGPPALVAQAPTGQAPPYQPSGGARTTAAPTAPAAPSETDLDDLMREINELSALRKALKAEFEVMGHGEAVAGLRTLTTHYVLPPAADDGDSAVPPLLLPPQQPPPQPAAAAPLLQWGMPGQPAAAAAAAVGPVPPTQLPTAVPQYPELRPPQQQAPLYDQQYQQQQAALYDQQYQQQAPLYDQQYQQQQVPPYEQPMQPPYTQMHPHLQQHPQQAPQQHQHPKQPPQAMLQWTPAATQQHQQLAAAGVVTQPRPSPPVTLAPTDQMPFVGLGGAWEPQHPVAAAAPPDAQGLSFAFAPPPHSGGDLLGPLPVAPPVLPTPPPPQQLQQQAVGAGLQWTIPAIGGAAAGGSPAGARSPPRGARVSGGGGNAAASPSPPSANSTPRKAAIQQPKRAQAAGGYAAPAAAADSPSGGDPRGATRSAAAQPAGATGSFSGGRGGAAAPAGAATERPLVNEGSYASAAVQARDRAEKERAAREALQAETAAAKAALVQRSKSERAAGSTQSPAAGGKEASPLGLKAPSAIGSYVRHPSPARPPARAGAAGRSGGSQHDAEGDLNTPGSEASGWGTPDAPAGAKPAWGTPTSSRPSRIPTPPRARDAPAAKPAAAAAAAKPPPPPPPPPAPAREDSFDSDLDFLERASDVSDTETDSPEAYGIYSKPPPQPRREAFASPSSASATAAYRERLADVRPHPLRIPSSGAATPMGGASTASTVASRAVPTGRVPGGGAGPGGAGARNGPGKPATPFTAAIRELMGLPGSAPLEQSRAAAGQQVDARGQWPSRLTDEEDKLLASLQRLDSDMLRRGLMAAGILNDQQQQPHGPGQNSGGAAKGPAAKGAPAGPAAKGAAAAGANKTRVGAAAAGGGGRGAGGGASHLNNSMQQDQLRESLDRLDLRLGALRRKMEDRACTLGMPAAAAPTPSSGPPPAAKRDATPTSDDRRGPPGTLAKSRTPTPNKAKANRDQRQQQLSAVQGPTPQPARAPAASTPPKPASAPVMGTLGAGGSAALESQMQQMQQHQQQYNPSAAAGAAGGMGGQPMGMPPRAPPVKAPASAPTGPAAANAALQQQQQQMVAGTQGMPYGMSPGTMPYGAMPNGGGGMFPHQQQGDGFAQQQAAGGVQQQQVAYVAAMLPNGQMAYVPQYVNSGGAGGFSGFFPGPQGMMVGQPQQQQMMQMQPGLVFAGVAQQQQQPYPQQGGGPVMAWGAGPQAPQHTSPGTPYGAASPQQQQQQQYGNGGGGGGPRLYSFDRGSSATGNPSAYSAVQDVTSHGGGGHVSAAQQNQQQQQAMPTLPYAMGPPPSGPMPHYHSSVMRSRSIGSRDGEAVVAAAAAAAAAAGLGPSFVAHHQNQQQQQQQQQGQSHAYNSPHQQPVYDQQPAAAQQAWESHPQQPPSQPHPVQMQSFGPNGSSRGVGAAGWGLGGPGGAGNGSVGGDAGVIKAVNLGLLLS